MLKYDDLNGVNGPLLRTTPGRGLTLHASGSKVLSGIYRLNADSLLTGLWVAGCRSELDRKQYEQFPEIILIRYVHHSGEVSLIKMRSDVANQLTKVLENGIVRARGMF